MDRHKLNVIIAAVCFLTSAMSPVRADELYDKALLIRSVEVVENARATDHGPWSFDQLTSWATGGNLEWRDRFLAEWQRTSANNGQPLTTRRSFDLLDQWHDQAPFRLLAIVFRLDLRSPAKPAGEGRFVFGLTGQPIPFGPDLTVILEYPLPTERWSLNEWAQKISDLSNGSGEPYLRQLEALTRAFSERPKRLTLRTNDFLFAFEWELRSFELVGRDFVLDLTAQTPADHFATQSHELEAELLSHRDAIENGTYQLGESWLGGASTVPDDFFQWLRGSKLPESTRHAFSLRTCNGCHSGETSTRFQHVFNRNPGQVAEISSFLKNEVLFRKTDLESILTGRSHTMTEATASRRGRPH